MSYNPVSSNTLLAYALNTLPDPLQVSPATGNIVYASLSFSISNNTSAAIEVSEILFTLPIGDLAQDITTDATAIMTSVSPAGVWNISMISTGLFKAEPASGAPVTVTKEGIIMQLFNIPVNQETGTVSISIQENASNPTSPAQQRNAVFEIAKFPYGFYFTNFSPNLAQVPDKGSVTLTWEGSDQATYSMNFGGAPVDVSELRLWVSPPLLNDTTFLLIATVVSDGQTVTRTLSTTVVVANPELSATSLAVSGTATIQGATSLSGAVTTSNGLTVGGAATLNNTLAVAGAATLSSLTVNQASNLAGGVSTAALTAATASISGSTSVGGILSAVGVSIMRAAKLINTVGGNWGGTYTAQTDGLVCGIVAPPANFDVPSAAVAAGSCNGMVVTAQGGSTCVLSMWHNSSNTAWNYNLTNSFTLPVPLGAQFSISASYPSNTAAYPAVSFYWIPFGVGGFNLVAEVADHPAGLMKKLPNIEIFTTENQYSHEPAINRLMGVLEELFGDKLNIERKVKLSEAVKALVYEEGKTTSRTAPAKRKTK